MQQVKFVSLRDHKQNFDKVIEQIYWCNNADSMYYQYEEYLFIRPEKFSDRRSFVTVQKNLLSLIELAPNAIVRYWICKKIFVINALNIELVKNEGKFYQTVCRKLLFLKNSVSKNMVYEGRLYNEFSWLLPKTCTICKISFAVYLIPDQMQKNEHFTCGLCMYTKYVFDIVKNNTCTDVAEYVKGYLN